MASFSSYLSNAPDVFLGVVLLVVAALVVAARRSDSRNLLFAAFLGLLAVGYVLDSAYLVTLGTGWNRAGVPATPTPLQETWLPRLEALRIAGQVLNPLALLAFAVAFCAPSSRARRALALCAGGAATFLAADLLLPIRLPIIGELGVEVGPFGSTGPSLLLLAYGLGAYAAAFVLLWKDHASATSAIRQRQGHLVLVGLGIAVFSRFGLSLETSAELVRAISPPVGPAYQLLFVRVLEVLLTVAATLAAGSLLLRRTPLEARPRGRRALRRILQGFGLLALVVWAPTPVWATLSALAHRGVSLDAATPGGYVLLTLERARYSSRWLVFAGLVGYSILRFQLFGLPPRAQRAGLRALATAGVLVGGGILALLLVSADPSLFSGGPLGGVLLAFLLALLGFLALSAVERALPLALAEDATRPRRLEVYQAALERSLEGSSGGDLPRLRRDLGLSDEEVRLARGLAERAVPLREGLLLASRYRIRATLGKGATGRTFLARDERLQRDVAVKEYDEEPAAGDVSQALAEARAAGALSHPNVVTVHDVVDYGRRHYLVMELAQGGTVADLLRARREVEPERARGIARDVLAGLAAVHEVGIVHGDVKPSNVLLSSGGAKLADFGSARILRSVTLPGAPEAGVEPRFTPRYAAPEVLAGAAPSPRSDVYSAGVVALDLLDGAAPGAFPERLDALAQGGPHAGLAGLLRRMLDRDPAARPEAGACLEAFEVIAPRTRGRSAPGG